MNQPEPVQTVRVGRRHGLWSLALATAVLAAALTSSPAARAEDTDTRAERVDRLTRFGFGLAKRNKYPEAVKAFLEALSLSTYPDGSLFYNLGKLQDEGLKQCGAALIFYQGYLANFPAGEMATEVQTRLTRCRAAVVSTLGRVTITAKYEGVPLRVDGVPLGTAPVMGLELPAGQYTVTTEADDFLPTTDAILVDVGLEARVDLRLERRMFKGLLTVEVDPPDASIFIDERLVAEKSPFTMKEAPTRIYLVRVDKPGWDRWVRYVTVERDTEAKVEVVLEQTGEQVPIPPLPRQE